MGLSFSEVLGSCDESTLILTCRQSAYYCSRTTIRVTEFSQPNSQIAQAPQTFISLQTSMQRLTGFAMRWSRIVVYRSREYFLMLLPHLLTTILLWLQGHALAPARMEYIHLEREISKIYGLSAKVPPPTYVLVTESITVTKVEGTSTGEVILYGDIQLKWDDETIAWDPRSFKNITYTLIHSTTIWYPRPRFRDVRHTVSDQLIEADYKGKCQCRVHFSITLMSRIFRQFIIQFQAGEEESSVMVSPAHINVLEPAFGSSSLKISFIDQWHDKRSPNVLNILFDLSKQCEIDAKRMLMMCSRFIAQLTTFLIKPHNVHRITVVLISTLLALTESSIADCIRSSDHVVSMTLLIAIIAETFTILMIYRLREWILIRRSQHPTSLPFYDDIPLRSAPILGSFQDSSPYQPGLYDVRQVGSRRPRSVMLPSDLPSIPLPRASDAKVRQHEILKAQLSNVWKKLIIADRLSAVVIAVCYVVLEATLG
ncbi:hypothetical protein Tcan_12787 [Toxocara canis]|uniref:Neur_chan_LBD domain-containing protein n=1 Tax=Toxocara canis TaxID=6265 RepID=A0A0B2UST8_TOXCA|nr:hypothetical protein Tcan_12787 [Toxocara canis]